jgi:hypothetical protein
LQVGISDEKLDSFNARVDHPVHGVSSAATDSDHFYPRAGDRGIIVDENIYACSRFTSVHCHIYFLSPKAGRLPRPFSSILGSSRLWHRYVADNILCGRDPSIQQLVKKYY